MKYDGYTVGPNLRQLRKDKKLSLYQVSEKTGLSQSSITQVEQGGRNLSMKSLYLLMDVYECDANTILSISRDLDLDSKNDSIDSRLKELPEEQQKYLKQTFLYMLDQAAMLAS